MRAKVLTVVGAATLILGAGISHAKPPEIYPLSQVKRGQKGYGMTTFQGTTPERFEFEVIGVMRNFLPKLDIILVKSDDAKVQVSGFWRGMSGSPLYIDGKLACAFSYGFQFNKLPIGGCTPLEYMKREGFKTPRHLNEQTGAPAAEARPSSARRTKKSAPSVVTQHSVASLEEWLAVAPDGTVDSAMRKLGAPREPWLMAAPRPPGPGLPTGAKPGDETMRPLGIPLALSGFSAPAFQAVEQLFADYPLQPMQGAGGTGSPNEGPTQFTMGGSIGVSLIRGDMSAAGTGTVSYIDGSGVLAFGHPMFQAGEFYAPVTAAEVHTVIPSAASPFVVASPMRELGTLIQDRKSTIMADTSVRTRMVPVDIKVDIKGDKDKNESGTFRTEVLNDRFFTSTLATVAVLNAVNEFMPDRDRVTARVHSRVQVRGYGTLEFVDYMNSSGGALQLIGGARGLRALVPLLNNPWKEVQIERIDFEVKAAYDNNYGDIQEIRLPTRELTPGKRNYVLVEMTTFEGDRIIKKVPFDVPKKLAGSIVRLEVTAGDGADIDVAPPQSMEDLVAALKQLLPGDVFAVTLFSADEGTARDGKLIRDLPPTAADKLRVSTSSDEEEAYHPLYRSLSKSDRVINGKKSILVKVATE